MDPIVLLIFAALVLVVALAGFVGVRSRSRKAPPGSQGMPPLQEEAPESLAGEAPPEITSAQAGPATAPAPPAPVPVPPVPSPPPVPAPAPSPAEAPPEDKVSLLSRGLAKTRGALGRTLSALSGAERLDEEDWDDVEAALISADVGVKATTRIVHSLKRAKLTPATLREALKAELLAVLTDADRKLEIGNSAGPAVWLVTGVNGVGKTTTLAKLAYRMKAGGNSVVLAAADTFRAAAIDQLGTWAERVGVHMVAHAPGADPGAVIFDAIEHAKAKKINLVIADTAGRLHTKSNLMEELKKVHRIAAQQAGGISEVLLVLDATVGQNGIAQARTFQEAVGVTGLVLAKLDGSAKGGVALAVEEELGIPVKMVGVGETLEALEPFSPREFVEALIEGG